ncbi:MAG: hypothetical protein UW07_C0006G0004 [Candidatus Nomurabacteria bacterium GW2011_GWF2_43_8]|uniref:Uncharacterized protein n=3 Tax=Candidatus Nomuraibacteriota TaxID=1752729 RepID=A0A0G1FQW4_9BACT|nr:MAG: hypothetical protein UV76_C0010G0016 [Candidatus Nomurabacteria bacterium GW2011_GWA2_43_15]KKT19405.1 MAG: hypothetical protein UW02_C0010G0007 [Candidatus Nomurabacteria bacterium GW2011_GWB1_43_7]KKT24886.1 MAG: hypothetical protein UW07_C0006G0004 [Candidatus Nomurabacteria bacterium GW2011_GWF2_43_8]
MTYSNIAIKDLINRDSDQDGILDWEEGLWGTDPAKKETTPGIPDSVTISKLKAERANSAETLASAEGYSEAKEENLTETDKFSRELFSTVAALSQSGVMDEVTVEKISSSLAEHLQNTTPSKEFTLLDIKVTNDESFQAVKNYNYALRDIYTKYQPNESIADILQEFAPDQNTVNADALAKLDPIIERSRKIIIEIAKTPVPQSLSSMHLGLLNALERLTENLNDIKLYNVDAIVALGAITQYGPNTVALRTAANNLTNAIKQKWQN